MLIQDLLSMSTKRINEVGAAEEAEAVIKIVMANKEAKERVWQLTEACRMTMCDRSKTPAGFKTVGLLGSEMFVLDGAYIGKANGIIFQFKPISEETKSVLGIEASADIVIELSATQKMPLNHVPLNLDPPVQGLNFKAWVISLLEGRDIKKIAEEAAEAELLAEQERLQALAKEKEEIYGKEWGNW